MTRRFLKSDDLNNISLNDDYKKIYVPTFTKRCDVSDTWIIIALCAWIWKYEYGT